MRTVAASLLTALNNAPPAPVAIVRFVLADRTISFVTGDRRRFGFAPSVLQIDPISLRHDTESHKSTISGVSLTMRPDGAAREIFVGRFLKNKIIQVLLGADGVTEANFETIWTGKISDCVPSGTSFLVSADSFSDLLEDTETSLRFQGNTLEVLLDLLTNAAAGDIDTAYIATSTFDPANYTDTISHYQTLANYTYSPLNSIQPFHNYTPNPTTSVRKLIDEICAGLPGFVYQGTDGLIRFKLMDPDGSVSRHIKKRDLIDFRVNSTVADTTNQATYNFFHDDETNSFRSSYTAKSAAAQTAAALPGSTRSIDRAEPVELRWFTAAKFLRTALTDSATSVVVGGVGVNIFTGESSDTDQQPSADRPVYLRIDDEIIEATSIAFTGTFVWAHPVDGVIVSETVADSITFGGCTRGALGTTAVAHTRTTQVTDYTQAVGRAGDLVRQRAYGSPRVSVTLPLSHLELEELDLITFDHDVYAFYGVTAANSNTVWRIVEISIAPFGSSVGIHLGLEWVRDNYAAAVTAAYTDARTDAEPLMRPLRNASDRDLIADAWVTTGLGFTAGVGLSGTLALGELGTLLTPVSIPENITRTFTASKDTYIYVDRINGGVVFLEVAVAGSPDPLDSWSALWMVRTNGSAITAQTDFRKTKPLDGDKLQSGSVPGTALDDAIAGDALLMTAGVLDVRVDGVTIGINGSDELEVLTSGGAPVGAQYLTLATDATLTNERVATAGNGVSITDAGAGSTATFAVELATNPGLEFSTAQLRAKVDGTTISRSASGLKVTDGGIGPTQIASGYGLLSGLTATRVPFASSATALTDAAGFTYASGVLDVPTRVRVNNAGTTAPLVVGGQSSAGHATTTASEIHCVGADGAASGITIDRFGSTVTETCAQISLRSATGTLASPTAPGINAIVGGVYARKFTSGTSYGIIAGMEFISLDTGGSARGGKIRLITYRPASTQAFVPVEFYSYQTKLTPDFRGSNSTTKSAPSFLFTGNANDNIAALTASTNVPDWRLDFNRSKQHATGAGPARQSDFEILAATHIAVGASTYPKVSTGYNNAPTAGTNMTITLPLAWEFGGAVLMTSGRLIQAKGADIASANDLTLALDGCTFGITGTTQINGIKTASLQAGEIVHLIFAGAVTVKHAGSPTAGWKSLKLSGSVDLTTAADTVLSLVYDGTNWQEISRKVA